MPLPNNVYKPTLKDEEPTENKQNNTETTGQIENPNNGSGYKDAFQETRDFNDEEANKYYENLKSESYRTLLNQQVQAAAAKENALKYTNNMMQRSGYGTQGVSESTGLGISNSYRNALATYQNDYNNALNEAATGAQDIANANRDESFDYLIGSIGQEGLSKEQFDSSLNNYGITYNDDGSLNFDNTNFNKLQQQQLNEYAKAFNEANVEAVQTDGFYTKNDEDIVFDEKWENSHAKDNDKTAFKGFKVTGISADRFIDDDIDVGFLGKNYDLDISWKRGARTNMSEEDFKKNIETLNQRYPNPESNQFVIYKDRVYFYSVERGAWGVVQKNTGGTRLYDDLKYWIENGTAPTRWKNYK